MLQNDTIRQNDSLFVPLYLMKDTTAPSDTSDNMGFTQYVSKIPNDSFPYLKYSPSLFTEKTYVFNRHMQPKPLVAEQKNTDWLFIIVLLLFSCIVVVFHSFRYRGFEILRSCFSLKEFEFFSKSVNGTIFLTILPFVFVIALIAWNIIDYFNLAIYLPFAFTTVQLFGALLLSVFAFLVARMGLIAFFGSLFRTGELTRLYLLNQSVFFFLDFLLLFPITTFALFTPSYMQLYFLAAACVVLILLILVRLVRGMCFVFYFSKFPRVYLFCYLCIVELLPFFIVVKLLISK